MNTAVQARIPFRQRTALPRTRLPRIPNPGSDGERERHFFDLLERYRPGSEEALIVLRQFTR